MKQKLKNVNILLAILWGFYLWVSIIWQSVIPNVVFPVAKAAVMAAGTLVALVLEYYLAESRERKLGLQSLLAGVTFWILSLAAGRGQTGIWMFVLGGILFAAITFLFDFMVVRIEATIGKKSAILPAALVLYLACQCFMGIF